MSDQLAPFDKLSELLQSLQEVFAPTELPAPANQNEAQADEDFERAVEELKR